MRPKRRLKRNKAVKKLLKGFCSICDREVIKMEADYRHGATVNTYYWRCEHCNLEFDIGTYGRFGRSMQHQLLLVWKDGKRYFASEFFGPNFPVKIIFT